MTVNTRYYVICDECGRTQLKRYGSIRAARGAAHADGWITKLIRRVRNDICWRCIENAAAGMNTPDLKASVRNRERGQDKINKRSHKLPEQQA